VRVSIWVLTVTAGLALGCAGLGDPGTPEPGQVDGLEDWQQVFAAKPDKEVRDYLMLLPRELLECEGVPPGTFDEDGRDAMTRSKREGYLLLDVEGMERQVKVYPRPEGDVVVTVLNCGMGCMCNSTTSTTWTKTGWSEVEVLDGSMVDRKVQRRLGPDAMWWLQLPEEGDHAEIVDEDGKVLHTLKWRDGGFRAK